MFYLLLNIIVASLSSQNVWELSTTIDNETHRTIRKFEVVDSNTVFFGSTGGKPNYIFKSTDKGKIWFKFKDLTPFNEQTLTDLTIIDSNIYISFFDDGVILKSTDYGESFEKIGLAYKNIIHDLFMFDENFGLANMPNCTFFKTNNSWETSATMSFPYFFNMSNPKKYKDKFVFSIIFNFGDDKTSNPKYQFAKIDIANETVESKDIFRMNYNDLEIINDSVFYLCGNKDHISGGSGHDAVFKSTDAGKTWRTILDLYSYNTKIPNQYPFGLQDIAFKNDTVGIAVGQFGKILYTYDGGESWFYEQNLPRIIDSLSPPTMLVTYAGDRAIIGDFTGAIHTLEVDNLAPKPEDTLTISGKIISEDSLAITCIPIRLNNNRITMTDNEGNYIFTKLSSGNYTVTALNKYFDGENPSFHFEPYLYSPVHTFELKADTTEIDFFATNIRGSSEVTGSIILEGKGLSDIEVLLVGDKLYKDTTNEDGFYSFQNIGKWNKPYNLSPNDTVYNYEPESYSLYINENLPNKNFEAEPISSVTQNPNFQIRDNVLISEEVVGMNYRIISLSGRVVKSAHLPKDLNLNAHPTGTYILQITKGEQVIFTHKFQVLR